jgi:uncharacterized protein (DUF433 family)
MLNSQKNLFQVRLSEQERRFIRSLAAGQGMTHQQAVVAAFTAWAEKLGSAAATSPPRPTDPPPSQPNRVPENHPARPATANWLQKAAKLDWTTCPDVEILHGKDRRLWVVRGTLAPLKDVLQVVAEGHPLDEVAESFGVELPQLTHVLRFAGAVA